MIHSAYGGNPKGLVPGEFLGEQMDYSTIPNNSIVTRTEKGYFFDPDLRINGEHYLKSDTKNRAWIKIRKEN